MIVAYFIAMVLTTGGELLMKSANILELKNHLSQFLRAVESGEEVEVCKRNVPFARIVPLHGKEKNRTKLGCALNSVIVRCDLTEPAMPEDEWEMLKGEQP